MGSLPSGDLCLSWFLGLAMKTQYLITCFGIFQPFSNNYDIFQCLLCNFAGSTCTNSSQDIFSLDHLEFGLSNQQTHILLMSEKDAGKICLFQQTNSLLKVQIFEILIIAVKGVLHQHGIASLRTRY